MACFKVLTKLKKEESLNSSRDSCLESLNDLKLLLTQNPG